MSKRATVSILLGLSAVVSVGVVTQEAHAQKAKACAEAASSGQVLRDDGKLIQAREKFVLCAQPGCPPLIQKDCAEWQAAVEARLPTIVVAVKDDAGKELPKVPVTMDGEAFTVDANGRSTPVNPGEHRFQAQLSGYDPVDEKLLIREGDRARTIVLTLRKPKPAAVIVEPPYEPTPRGGPGPLPYVLAGVGIVGIGLGTFFYLSARSEYSDLESACKPNCSDDAVSSVETKQAIGFVALGVGAAAAIGSVVLFATSSGAVSVKAGAARGGARALFETRF